MLVVSVPARDRSRSRSRVRLLAAPVLAILAVAALSAASPAPAAIVHLETYAFDPTVGEPFLAPSLTVDAISGGTVDAAGYGYWIVHLTGAPDAANRAALEAAGAEVFGYLAESSFLAGLDARARTRLAADPAVAAIVPFHPAYKISPEVGLQEVYSPERLQEPGLRLMVRVFRDLDTVENAIASLGLTVLNRTDDGFSRRLLVLAPRERVEEIARIRDVWWIEEQPEFRLWNNTTKWVLQSNSSGWTPLWDYGLQGEGQIFTLMDSGVDYNACWFRENGNAAPGPNHRKVIDYSLFGGNAYDGCDTGHGSHVAGTVAGDQSYVNSGNYNYNGMAYRSKFTVQDVGADDWSACNLGTVNVPSSLSSAFLASFNLSARVHTNSWGSTSNTYDGYCVDVDNAMWQRKDFLVCFAAGNSGPNASTVGSPGTAKNCLTVGATRQAPQQETMASYSSRGPASDSRYKPTVTAPGGESPNYISSVDNNPNNPPSATCNVASSPFQGTSMATPAVAGCALLTRQYYTEGFYPDGAAGEGDPFTPSAALVKATLIASTDDMGTADIPNNNEGWGRVLMDNSLYFTGDTRELFAEDIAPGLTAGQEWSTTVTVDDAAEPLSVTLVWTDYPGTSGSGIKLVNDLDLTVTDPGGTVYKGNVFSAGYSVGGGSEDRRNVEECVRRANPPAGEWTVRVRGAAVPQGPQPFAVVINGAFAQWPPSGPSAVAEAALPSGASVHAAPNPSSAGTVLHYALPAGFSGAVELVLVDVGGRRVRSLVQKGQRTGEYRASWDGLDDLGRSVPDGVYFARLRAGDTVATSKIVVRR